MDLTVSAGTAPTEDSALVQQASSEHGEPRGPEPRSVRRLPLAVALLAALSCAAGISYRLYGSVLRRQPLQSPALPIVEQAESKGRHALLLEPSAVKKAESTGSHAKPRARYCLTLPG